MKSFYVTTPIYYVNDNPHIGHIYTTVIADVVARYRRLKGDEVYFLTGTDEHGQKIERAAAEKGLKPIELADRVVSRYHDHWKAIGISHDDFIRTTEARHRRAVEAMVERMQANDDLYIGKHEGWYCAGCESFYTEKELLDDKRCPVHETEAEWKSEENVFFRLSKYEKRLLDWYEQHPEFVQPDSRMNEVRSFVEGGLKDLSVSRNDLDWGIPFPGYPGQTVYVWLDAVTNYISALGFGSDDPALYERFWSGESQYALHLVGKDILRFHAVWWPAFLMSAELPLPNQVWAHGWWLRDQKKMSKSVGNIVRPGQLLEAFGADPLRYFLLREMVFGQDAQFSDEGFIDRFNSDLANDLGNTISRIAKLTRRTFGGKTPKGKSDGPLKVVAEQVVAEYREAMDRLAFQAAMRSLWRLLSETNQYLVENAPWKLVKQEGAEQQVAEVLWNAAEAVRIIALGLLPVMPDIAPKILQELGAPSDGGLEDMVWGGLAEDQELGEAASLFPRIDKKAYLPTPEAVKEPEASPGPERDEITIDDFFRTELEVAEIKTAERIPKSEKLLHLTVELDGEQRSVVAGIAASYTPEELVGTQVVLVANLKPAKLMGRASQGMVLAATVDGKPVLVRPESVVAPGTRVK